MEDDASLISIRMQKIINVTGKGKKERMKEEIIVNGK